MPKRKIVVPESDALANISVIANQFEGRGVDASDARWIAETVDSRALPEPGPDDGDTREDAILNRAHHTRSFAEDVGTTAPYDRDIYLTRLLFGLCAALAFETRRRAGPGRSARPPGAVQPEAAIARRMGRSHLDNVLIRKEIAHLAGVWANARPRIDFAKGMGRLGQWHATDGLRHALARALHRVGALSPAATFSIAGHLGSWPLRGEAQYCDPKFAQFWLAALGSGALRHLLPPLSLLDTAQFALAAERLFEAAMETPASEFNGRKLNTTWRPGCCGRPGVRVLRELLAMVEVRLESAPRHLQILSTAWRIGRVLEGRGSGLDSATRERLLSHAHGALGGFRKTLGAAERDDGLSHPDERRYAAALFFIGRASGYGKAIRSALLMLRELRVPAVAPDLRYYPEGSLEPPPRMWAWIPLRTVDLVHLAERETPEDEDLEDLREVLADHFLSRLESREGRSPPFVDDDFVEPDAVWRQCTVQAVGVLRVNPRGKAHRVLKWVASNDPDDDVRDDARIVADEIRRGTMTAPGMSARRVVLAALWWTRQAHAISTGVDVHESGANRTRQTEGRRPREVDDLN